MLKLTKLDTKRLKLSFAMFEDTDTGGNLFPISLLILT